MNIGSLIPWPLNADLTDFWVLWATVFTAIGTVVLAVFAVFAWKSAKETLRSQQVSEQLSAASRYVAALYALARVSGSTPAQFTPPSTGNIHVDFALRDGQYSSYVDHLVDDVEVNGGLWRAYHSESAAILAPLIHGEAMLIEAQSWWKNPEEKLSNYRNDQFQLNAKYGRDFARLIFDWQVREDERKSLSALVEQEVASFIEKSPCNPGKATESGIPSS
ncbi:hypothetical protein CIK76_04970 [Glutamicibacter sp. BW80]|uniref:hypothetical protein n=1 Tax=Glutamicibacter sp. BW80 TaxID=2024404 RepID=UPI000BC4AE71|nr:hypothetical protein [Glutamicibacter sp. BW80]PCC29747.1 hypothetical protein CIK76_04970 [Glutamicibacter sp. BW80]